MSRAEHLDLDLVPREALLEMHAHASAMRDLVAQHVNSGPGGLWGRMDRLVSDIEAARPYRRELPEETAKTRNCTPLTARALGLALLRATAEHGDLRAWLRGDCYFYDVTEITLDNGDTILMT